MVIAFHLTIISPKTSDVTRRRCRGEVSQPLASLSRPAVEVFGTAAKHPQGEPADRQQEEEGDGRMGGGREGGRAGLHPNINFNGHIASVWLQESSSSVHSEFCQRFVAYLFCNCWNFLMTKTGKVE